MRGPVRFLPTRSPSAETITAVRSACGQGVAGGPRRELRKECGARHGFRNINSRHRIAAYNNCISGLCSKAPVAGKAYEQMNAARASVKAGDLIRALETLEVGLAYQQTAELWAAWGTVQYGLGNLGLAEYGLRSALQIDIQNVLAIENLARLCKEQNRVRSARALLERAARKKETWEPGVAGLQEKSGVCEPFAMCMDGFPSAPEPPSASEPRQSIRSGFTVCEGNAEAVLRMACDERLDDELSSANLGGARRSRLLRGLIQLATPVRILAYTTSTLSRDLSTAIGEVRRIDTQFRPCVAKLATQNAAPEGNPSFLQAPRSAWKSFLSQLSAGDLLVVDVSTTVEARQMLDATGRLAHPYPSSPSPGARS